ncbi:MAG: DNA polymerase III subunit gamma/tau [Deltaproteobacteria bacterium]|nr:DNA polymerase III subunit gamma/tau [Deltaproteobacteria bacterium]
MAYQVLARKWRPQTFEEVVGQEPITRTLQNALASGRVAHAFLFSGPRGVGKTSVARILAKALNCVAGPTPQPDNTCEVCRQITNGSSLDVLEIDGASNRGIDEVRDLREKIKYLPAQGKFKVYIIDEVHMLTKEAFNALLKTLEEPPAHAVFILATTEPHKVPVTILSRCQRYDFRRIPTGLIQEYLGKLASQEGWHIDPEGLALVARAAEGGLRDAQGFLDQVVTFGGEDVTPAEIARILGVTDRGALLSALQAVIDRNGPEVLSLIDELYNQGHDLRRFYQDLVLYARHLLLAGLHRESRQLAAVADSEWEELTALARRTSEVHLHNLLTVLLQGEEELRRAAQPRLALEVLLLKLVHLEPMRPLNIWLEKLEKLEQRLESRGIAAAKPAPVAQASPPVKAQAAPPVTAVQASVAQASQPAEPLVPADATLPEKWDAFLQFVQDRGEAPLYGRLSKCLLIGETDHRLQLETGPTWNAVGRAHESHLRELVRVFFGEDYDLEIKTPEAKPPAKKAAAKKSFKMTELKQQALEVFGGAFVSPGKEDPE